MKKLLVIDVAALGWTFLQRAADRAKDFGFRKAETIFPALTSTVQASFRTASLPAAHGIVANGLFFPTLKKVSFWEQSASLVAGRRIWSALRASGRTAGMMFWQQSLGESVDLALSPKPVHKHHGGMIEDCYTQPPGLYARLRQRLGAFSLANYWGPLASVRVNRWIAQATCEVMRDPAPDLLMVYLPGLDYELQRSGPGSAKSFQALEKTLSHLSNLRNIADAAGYDWLIFGDYAIEPVADPVFPNRALHEAGLFAVREVHGREYPDFFASRAFAVADHQVALIAAADRDAAARAADCLRSLEGVESVVPEGKQLVATAKAGRWMAYPWWTDRRAAPDYASHVDIHNKPGYDPCELFLGWPPGSVGQNPSRVRGSHGRTGPGTEIAWASSLALGEPAGLLDLARGVEAILK